MQSDRLTQRMKQYGPNFTESERAIAEYLLRNGARVAFAAAALLSRDIGVSEATLVRFSRTLGYDSYTALQKDVQGEIEERLNKRPRDRLAGMARSVSPHWDALEKVILQDVENLVQTLNYCTPDDFAGAIKLLLAARQIFVFGMRAAAPIAAFFGYSLNLVTPGVVTVTNRNDDHLDAFISAQPQDVLVVMGVSRQSRSALGVVEYAKKRGLQVISITDGPATPYAKLADVILMVECESPSLLVSHTPMIALCQAMVAAVGASREAEAGERVAQLEEILDHYLDAQ